MRYLSLLIVLALLTLNCSENSTSGNLSSEKEIMSFTIATPPLVGEVDNIAKTVRIKVTPDIDRTSLAPVIQVSPWATVNPLSGTAQNFTNSVNYIVTAEDESTSTYGAYTEVGNYILNSCLLVVHMQKHFVNNTGIQNRTEVISSISTILNSAREENIHVVFSKSMPLGDRDIITELTPRGTETVIESSTNFSVIEAIDALHVQNIVVVGVITHQCIKDACNDLKNAGYNVILVEDATSVLMNQDISLIQSTCTELEQAGTVRLISTDEILF